MASALLCGVYILEGFHEHGNDADRIVEERTWASEAMKPRFQLQNPDSHLKRIYGI